VPNEFNPSCGDSRWAWIIDKPSTFAPSAHAHAIDDVTGLQDALDNAGGGGAHTHPISDVVNLQASLDGKSGTSHNHDAAYAPAIHNHDGSYALPGHDHDADYAPLVHSHDYAATTHNHDANYAALSHAHAISDVTNLQTTLNGKASTSHSHAISDTTGLQTALDGKSATSHNHDGVYATAGHTHAQLHNQQHSITSASDHTFPGGTTTFLRADGTFATPSGGSDPFMFKGVLASDVSTGANVTPVNVTGLVFTYEANSTYVVEVFALMQSPAATTGYGLQFDVSTAITAQGFAFFHQLANTGTLSGGSSIADDASVGVSSGVPTLNVNVPLYGSGIIRTGANTGTAQLRLRSETTAVATMKAGSAMRVHKLA
jgi:hypothetical protein